MGENKHTPGAEFTTALRGYARVQLVRVAGRRAVVRRWVTSRGTWSGTTTLLPLDALRRAAAGGET